MTVYGIPKLTRFDKIKERKLEWLWPGRIPIGKLTVIAGDPGFGKSLFTRDGVFATRCHKPNQ